MKITKQMLRTHAERLLETLREEGITSLESALKYTGKEVKPREMLPNTIHIHSWFSASGRTALSISCKYQDFEERPIELVINPILNCRLTIAKCQDYILNYTPFGFDEHCNVQQYKKSRGTDWMNVIKDVEELARLK